MPSNKEYTYPLPSGANQCSLQVVTSEKEIGIATFYKTHRKVYLSSKPKHRFHTEKL